MAGNILSSDNTIEKKCNDMLGAVVSQLVAYQTDYARTHAGRFWQGIRTHPVLPVDGNETAPDKTRKPTDQAEDWSGITLSANMLIAVEVHTHRGPAGDGYTVFGWIKIGERTWQRAVGVGAHATTSDWADVTLQEVI